MTPSFSDSKRRNINQSQKSYSQEENNRRHNNITFVMAKVSDNNQLM